METKNYKVETKPTFWVVDLEKGRYSDYSIESLYFHANSVDEVWNFLCRYVEDIYNGNDWDDIKALNFENENKHYVVDRWLKKRDKKLEDVDFDSDYGDAKKVSIRRLDVIYFRN